MQHERVVVIGAGPGGLAVAAARGERGVSALVVDRAPHVGASWRGHYERLHLHTPRTGHRIDYRGAALLSAAVTALILAVTWGLIAGILMLSRKLNGVSNGA